MSALANEKEINDVDLPSDEEEEEGATAAPIEEEVTDLSNTEVMTKYMESARILNLCLTNIVPLVVAGATPLSIMKEGEAMLTGLLGSVYSSKKNGKSTEKGIAFPICISVNEKICNYSPLESEEQTTLAAGDWVKLDLGCHIDGFIAVTAHTLIVPDGDSPITVEDDQGDVAVACYKAVQVAAALIRPGNTNTMVTAALERVSNAYGVNVINNVRMHQMKKFVIDGKKEILLRSPNKEKDEEKIDEVTFEENEVYALDICMSTGEGEGRQGEDRTTVFKRNVETKYSLKMKNSHKVLKEVSEKAGTMVFSLRTVEEERVAKAGVVECVKHNLFSSYPVFVERRGAKVAHFKTTLLVTPGGNKSITGLPLPEYFTSTKALDEENATLLAEVEAKAAAKAAKALAKKNKKKAGKK